MCGIAGILSLSPERHVAPEPLGVMAGALQHRGPDDERTYVDPQGRCGLAFRRLSIIDLTTGQQPISNEDGTVQSVFNGEIYNFRTLRQALQARGHQFRTQGDAEVIVHLYEEHGLDFCKYLAGMFAIALWDANAGRLVLARDRLGKKPLTYAIHNQRLYFASEAKAILALPEIPRAIDAQSLHRYLLFQYVPAPHSVFRGFGRVEPGTLLELKPHVAPHFTPRRYWSIPRPPRFAGTYRDARARLGELFTQAVEKRLISDVPLGAFLSGGIDSSLVVWQMRKLGVSPLRTFSIGFADRQYDESSHARQVAERYQTEHHEMVVTPQARELFDALAYHYDEPFADSSAIPTFYLSRFTRESVTVALTGDAGDECFAGYDRYWATALADRVARLPAPVSAGVRSAAGWLPHDKPKSFSRRLYRFLQTTGKPPAERYMRWMNVFSPALLSEGYRADFREKLDFAEPLHWFTDLYDDAPGPVANQAVHTDFASYLPYDLLVKVDIASMAYGLECRSPFLDHELVEFALSLPLEWRLRRGNGKRILKDLAAEAERTGDGGGFPLEVCRRRKMGFGVPIGQWFRTDLRPMLEQELLDPRGIAASIFRPEWLKRFVGQHLSGHANHEHALWALLMLTRWHQRWRANLP